MNARIIGLSLLAAGLLALPAQAAANPLVDAVQSLCMPNHADPAKVIAAAEAAGWGPLGPEGRAQAKDRFDTFNPTMREKVSEGRRLLLVVGDSRVEGDGRMETRHRCWIESDRPNSEEVIGELQIWFGRDPTLKVGAVSGWAYVEEGGQRTFISGNSQMKVGATLVLVMTSAKGEHENIGYNESAP
jgi:hypothetical protein